MTSIVQVMLSEGETIVESSCRVGPLYVLLPTCHVNVGVSVSPSSSFAVLVQVKNVEEVTPVLGVMLVPESVGARLSNVVLVLIVADSPSSSVTLAVHRTSLRALLPHLRDRLLILFR